MIPPFYGWVKRAMNRKPQPADSWWSSHQASCSGTFIKVSEPENFKKVTKEINKSSTDTKRKGRTWSEADTSTTSTSSSAKASTIKTEQPKLTDFFQREVPSKDLSCVNCSNYKTISLRELNEHLDSCLQLTKPVIDLTE